MNALASITQLRDRLDAAAPVDPTHPEAQYLALLRDMYDLSPAFYKQRLERLDDVLGLADLLPVVARKLSLGQRMR